MEKINVHLPTNRFIPIDSEELTALELIGKLVGKSNELVDGLNTKTDLAGNHLGQWQGLDRPTMSEEGVRSTVEKLMKYLDIFPLVDHFGATGNGSTDDTNAFIRAFENNSTIRLSENKVYIVDNLILSKNVTIIGGTIKRKDGSTRPTLKNTMETKMINVTLDGNINNIIAEIVPVQLNGAKLYGCTFKNSFFKMVETEKAEVTNCYFYNISGDSLVIKGNNSLVTTSRFEKITNGHCVRTGIHDIDVQTKIVRDVTITGNTFIDCGHVGVTCERNSKNVIITSNIFRNTNQGVKTEKESQGVENIIVANNIFEDVQAQISVNMTAKNAYFIGNILKNCNGAVTFENVSSCKDNTFTNCNNTNSALIDASRSNGIVISGNVINGTNYDGIHIGGGKCINNTLKTVNGNGIRLTGGGIDVIGNEITGCTNGIFLTTTIGGCTIKNNKVLGNTSSEMSMSINATTVTNIVNDNSFTLNFQINVTVTNEVADIPKLSNFFRLTSSGATTLTTLNGGSIGQVIQVRCASTSIPITIGTTGNIKLSAPLVLDSANKLLTLMWNGTVWGEVSRTTLI